MFTIRSLEGFDGIRDPTMLVASCEGEYGVYDVTPQLNESSFTEEDAEIMKQIRSFAGRQLVSPKHSLFVKTHFKHVGQFIVTRDVDVDELRTHTGDDGGTIWLSLMGEVYDVTKGIDFYGPDRGYHVFAGKDVSRAMALVSLDSTNIENTRIDDLTEENLQTLEQWRRKMESKYVLIGFLKGWSRQGSPVATSSSSLGTSAGAGAS